MTAAYALDRISPWRWTCAAPTQAPQGRTHRLDALVASMGPYIHLRCGAG